MHGDGSCKSQTAMVSVKGTNCGTLCAHKAVIKTYIFSLKDSNIAHSWPYFNKAPNSLPYEHLFLLNWSENLVAAAKSCFVLFVCLRQFPVIPLGRHQLWNCIYLNFFCTEKENECVQTWKKQESCEWPKLSPDGVTKQNQSWPEQAANICTMFFIIWNENGSLFKHNVVAPHTNGD